ncbi:MAG: hypothetical protein JW929_15200 [Anaerolineales bacterium]|nr:hypothetical protein [Anaerolineales bacterium]
MPDAIGRNIAVDTDQFYVLSPILPFLDIIFQSIVIRKRDFSKIIALADKYQEDPRMVEVVRKCGDASAKVPYLMGEGETKESILKALRGIAEPHIEYLNQLPEEMQTAIHLLLSINVVPRGYEKLGLPALLELDRIQREMIGTLRKLMENRRLAEAFHKNNQTALQMLDRDWPRIREEKTSPFSPGLLPENSKMQYKPFFDGEERLSYIQQTCVIVDSPNAKLLRKFIPRVLQDPLPYNEPVPVIGSAEWLIRNVGKIGRHVTRALLQMIRERLAAERIPLEEDNYELINRRALETLRNYVSKMP